MRPESTPHTVGVTVSTTEKPVYNRTLDGPLNVEIGPEEREHLRALVKLYGWYWTEAGVLRRHKFGRMS